jgi:hypothetical protein
MRRSKRGNGIRPRDSGRTRFNAIGAGKSIANAHPARKTAAELNVAFCQLSIVTAGQRRPMPARFGGSVSSAIRADLFCLYLNRARAGRDVGCAMVAYISTLPRRVLVANMAATVSSASVAYSCCVPLGQWIQGCRAFSSAETVRLLRYNLHHDRRKRRETAIRPLR